MTVLLFKQLPNNGNYIVSIDNGLTWNLYTAFVQGVGATTQINYEIDTLIQNNM